MSIDTETKLAIWVAIFNDGVVYDITVAPDLEVPVHQMLQADRGPSLPRSFRVHVDRRLKLGTWHKGAPAAPPSPAAREQGVDSEHYARSGKVMLSLVCPTCNASLNAEWKPFTEREPAPFDPTILGYRARKLAAEREETHTRTRLRIVYSEHRCAVLESFEATVGFTA